MRLFQYQDMTTILTVILAMVSVVDYLSSAVRARII
jgi:phosphonate transport system permease protein